MQYPQHSVLAGADSDQESVFHVKAVSHVEKSIIRFVYQLYNAFCVQMLLVDQGMISAASPGP
jgi:hypothetical protein